MRTEEQIKREVGILKDVPTLIQLAAQVYDNLPENIKVEWESSNKLTNYVKI